MARVLFHIDLNAFFASAEELRHPEYKDKPMAVGSLSNRGVLSTANYAAREAGVHSAMPIFQAKERCPELVIVPGDYAYYKELSNAFFKILRRFSPMLEPLGIDECFLDVTEPIKKYKRPLDLAVQIQQTVKRELGLSCSIGVSTTRFLAKMASDMRKPMGITVLRKSELSAKLYPLPVSDMVGIGKKTIPLLEKEGIRTIGDFVDPEHEQTIYRLLGKNALPMLLKAKGKSSDELVFSTSHKSLSLSRTVPNDIYSMDEVLSRMRDLTRSVCASMQKNHQKGKTISVVLRDTEFHNQLRSKSLEQYTDQFELLYEKVCQLVEENFEPVGYRHLGISVGSLLSSDEVIEQPTLFETPAMNTSDIVHELNRDLDKPLFMKASDLVKKES